MDPQLLIANGLTFAFEKSSAPGIAICLVLVILSSFSWAVMITKFRMVRRVQTDTDEFLGAYRERQNPLQLWQDGEADSEAPVAHVYRAASRELSLHLTGSPGGDPASPEQLEGAGKLCPTQMDPVECAMERSIGNNVGRLEGQMGVLATAVSGAPFLGLLGTVWGVMDTFSGVASAEGAASLKTMAPGVSAALLTTVVALLVAIPAMFGYNYLVNKIKGSISELDAFRNELRAGFERWYVDHGRPIPSVTSTTRRITAAELVNGAHDDGAPQPSHRVVKRGSVPDAEPLLAEVDADEPEALELVGEEITAPLA